MAGRGHDCLEQSRIERLSTLENPFHFTASGLPNVYLVGVRCFDCECGHSSAEIPALMQLLNLIARDLVSKPQALTGDEIRFLRKRLGKKASDFAKAIGVNPETLSRIENGHQSAGEQTDKLIRLTYVFSSGDEVLIEQIKQAIEQILQAWGTSAAPKKIVKSVKNNKWSEAKAA